MLSVMQKDIINLLHTDSTNLKKPYPHTPETMSQNFKRGLTTPML